MSAEGRATIVLASSSPRRRAMLEELGLDVIVHAPAIDDATVPIRPRDGRALVEALAWFKAAQVLRDPAAAPARRRASRLVAADTVCLDGERVLGKPVTLSAARAMIESLAGRSHRVVTGLCVVDLGNGARTIFSDEAVVTVGALDPSALAEHLRDDRWRGRAGGYNLSEVIARGWPVSCEGDPTTVMGLPMRRLAPILAAAAVSERDRERGGAGAPPASTSSHAA